VGGAQVIPIDTGDERTAGINGGLTQAGGGFHGTINMIEVEDIGAAIEKVLANGGEIALEKGAIPGVVYQAYFKDNTGIIVGLHLADPIEAISIIRRGGVLR
jgi:predicted enzyme related to lactoylglutathione lyase